MASDVLGSVAACRLAKQCIIFEHVRTSCAMQCMFHAGMQTVGYGLWPDTTVVKYMPKDAVISPFLSCCMAMPF